MTERPASKMQRIICQFATKVSGPTVFCTAGLHGSEPAGVVAAERVARHIRTNSIAVTGNFLAARGNILALKKGIRYLDHDLNRMWIEEDVQRVLASAFEETSVIEYAEMKQLALLLHDTIRSAAQPILLVDLHTTSSECAPFIYAVPSLHSAEILPHFHIPIVDDPHSCIVGTLGHYVAKLGQRVILAEGGHHDHHTSIEYCEAILWIALSIAGCVESAETGGKSEWAEEILQHAGAQMPNHFEVVYRHRVVSGDGFRMRPGFHSFQQVHAGEPLADDSRGEIAAPQDGWILMPLYKPPCDDGFLIVQAKDDRGTKSETVS